MIVDLPHPDGPTKATFFPAGIVTESYSNTFFSLDGYLNVRFLASIYPVMGVLSFLHFVSKFN